MSRQISFPCYVCLYFFLSSPFSLQDNSIDMTGVEVTLLTKDINRRTLAFKLTVKRVIWVSSETNDSSENPAEWRHINDVMMTRTIQRPNGEADDSSDDPVADYEHCQDKFKPFPWLIACSAQTRPHNSVKNAHAIARWVIYDKKTPEVVEMEELVAGLWWELRGSW